MTLKEALIAAPPNGLITDGTIELKKIAATNAFVCINGLGTRPEDHISSSWYVC